MVTKLDDWNWEMGWEGATLCILLGLSAAFDTINHDILLHHLSALVMGGIILRWFQSYIKDRFQSAVLGDCSLAPWLLGSCKLYIVPHAI